MERYDEANYYREMGWSLLKPGFHLMLSYGPINNAETMLTMVNKLIGPSLERDNTNGVNGVILHSGLDFSRFMVKKPDAVDKDFISIGRATKKYVQLQEGLGDIDTDINRSLYQLSPTGPRIIIFDQARRRGKNPFRWMMDMKNFAYRNQISLIGSIPIDSIFRGDLKDDIDFSYCKSEHDVCLIIDEETDNVFLEDWLRRNLFNTITLQYRTPVEGTVEYCVLRR